MHIMNFQFMPDQFEIRQKTNEQLILLFHRRINIFILQSLIKYCNRLKATKAGYRVLVPLLKTQQSIQITWNTPFAAINLKSFHCYTPNRIHRSAIRSHVQLLIVRARQRVSPGFYSTSIWHWNNKILSSVFGARHPFCGNETTNWNVVSVQHRIHVYKTWHNNKKSNETSGR